MGLHHGTSGGAAPSPEVRISVSEELERILESSGFRNSEQSKRLLRYLVEHSLDGQWEQLKERAIGAALFGREPGYDSNDDPIVRVRANEIRKRLARYYQAQGETVPGVRFDVPAGAYRVEFQVAAAPPEQELAAAVPAVVEPPTPAKRRTRRPWFAASTVLLVVLLAVSGFWFSRGDILDEFWGPALRSNTPVILCSGHPVVYRFSREFYSRRQGPKMDHFKLQTDPVHLGPDETIFGRDIVAVPNQYVGLGTAHALARLSAWLAGKNKDSEIRFGNDVSFTELRKSPAVLIGAFQNRWTAEFTRGLRFVFETADGVPGIRDTGTGKVWQLPQLKDSGETDEDYLIISRISDSETGQFLIAVAPITQYGCQAVAEILTRPGLLTQALAKAKPGWQQRNLQLLYHVQVIGQAPGPPKLLALHEW